MKKFTLYLVPLLVLTAGCKGLQNLPQTMGEENSAYTYIPIDPLPVFQEPGRSCPGSCEGSSHEENYKKLIESLPDQAVRLAVTHLDGEASGSFGPATIGYKNNSYQVVLDYISVDATQLPIYVKRVTNKGDRVPLYADSLKLPTRYVVSAAPRINPFCEENNKEFVKNEDLGDLVIVPVYIGVGLRMTASVKVTKGEVNLSSLGALAVAAEAGKLTGSLTIQTLGITGENVATSLPLPSEINQTTIQNAILSLGSIKAVLYDEVNTKTTPRIVGIYNPIGGGKEIVNGIISVLAGDPIRWYRPCVL
ncbi:hypothetical protein [Algoriphagus chordae]|uniref:Uncharacterized protein n=1 Tax=Algoriphagus chordae TaxID=237019 RepID=A0A2W7QVG4_9BACT|nr:hypothetical protein [Algoriphagus chordae]PZX52523.1 hypothetical protein LV85_01824 [Algoriphagus chordae]